MEVHAESSALPKAPIPKARPRVDIRVPTTEKLQRWQKAEAVARRTTDAVGLEIDRGILDTVVSLNVMGVNTTASCEGHMDHGTHAPYVDTSARKAVALEQQLIKLVWK